MFSFSLPLTKIAVRGLDPMVAAVGRAAVASVFALIALLIVRPPRPNRSQLWHLALVVGGVVFDKRQQVEERPFTQYREQERGFREVFEFEERMQ